MFRKKVVSKNNCQKGNIKNTYIRIIEGGENFPFLCIKCKNSILYLDGEKKREFCVWNDKIALEIFTCIALDFLTSKSKMHFSLIAEIFFFLRTKICLETLLFIN